MGAVAVEVVPVMGSGEGVASERRWPTVLVGAVAGSVWFLVVVAIVAGMGLAWIAGWRLEVVETPSMAPEIPVDALAVTRPVAPRNVEVGDVIAFREPTTQRRRILHRVVRIDVRGTDRFFTTQGDANETPDPYTLSEAHLEDRLLVSVPRLGIAVRLLQPPRSYLVLVGLPLAAAVVSEARRWRRRPTVIAEDAPRTLADVPPPPVAAAVRSAATPPGRRSTWVVIGAIALGLALVGQRRPARRRTI